MSRLDRINEMMRREISEILHREIQDPRLTSVTITAVKVSPDLHQARVSFSVLMPTTVPDVQKGLDHARGYIRRLIGQRIELRHIPEIEFFYDETIEYEARIEKTFAEIKRDMPFDQGAADGV